MDEQWHEQYATQCCLPKIPHITENTLEEFVKNWLPNVFSNGLSPLQLKLEESRFAYTIHCKDRQVGKTSYALIKMLYSCLRKPYTNCEYRNHSHTALEHAIKLFHHILLCSEFGRGEYMDVSNGVIRLGILKEPLTHKYNSAIKTYKFYNDSEIVFIDKIGPGSQDHLRRRGFEEPHVNVLDWGYTIDIINNHNVCADIEKPLVYYKEPYGACEPTDIEIIQGGNIDEEEQPGDSV